MIYNLYFKTFLFVIVLAASLLLIRFYLKKSNTEWTVRQAAWIIAGMVVLVCAFRIPYLRDREYDIDTSTWLSAVIAVNAYPDKLWTILNYSDARPLTVFPLVAGSWLGMPVSYGGAEIVGLVLWLGTTLLLYHVCRLFAGRTAGLIITWSFAAFLATFCHIFAAYNSEHVSILMVTAGVALFFLYFYNRWKSPLLAGLTGILLGSLIYAKFQNAPMGLLTGAFLLLTMAQRKDWRNIALVVAGCLLPTVLVNIYYGALGKLDEFWNNYFWNYFYYSFTTQFSSMPMAERFNPLRIVKFIYYATSSGVYLLVLTSLALALPMLASGRRRTEIKSKWELFTFSFLLLLLSFYAVLQSGNNFEHYKLFLFVPLLIFNGLCISISRPAVQKVALAVLTFGCVAQAAVSLAYLKDDFTYDPRIDMDRRIVDHITQHTGPADPVVVWGWRDGLLVNARRPMGYRDVHTFHFSMQSPLIDSWTEDFLDDMEQNKPLIFVEAMIPEYSERGDQFLPHDRIPVVREYVKEHYRFVKEMNGVRIFHRKGARELTLAR